MKKLLLFVFAPFLWLYLVLARAALLAMVLLFPALAFAQAAAPAPAGQPAWLALLIGIAPALIAGALAIHPLLKLAALLDAHALDKNTSAGAKIAFLGMESAAKSLDHFLEASGGDIGDLVDPAKRAAALQHIENAAKTGAMPALADAAEAMGAGWLTGAASQVIDAATPRSPPVQVIPPPAAVPGSPTDPKVTAALPKPSGP